MQIKVAVRHGHLGADVQETLRAKAEKLVHLFERLTMIEVTVDMNEVGDKSVEFRALAEHKHEFVARESAAEVVTAADLAIHKIKQQVTRHKEKLQDHRRDPSTGEFAADAGRGTVK